MTERANAVDDALIRVCDLAGRPRGSGFLADTDGTMITSHEAVDGLARLVLHGPGGQVCLVEAEAVTVLPEAGLALVATEGLAVPPLAVAPRGPGPGRRILLRLPQRTAGVVVGTTAVTYTATDRFHLLDEVYELALDGVDLSRPALHASGAPVVDAATGAVFAVVATALQAAHRAGGFAVPLRAEHAPPALAELLARNAATVPAYGAHLNLAGALQLTGTSVGSAARPGPWREPVDRPAVAGELRDFLARRGASAPLVLGLVGEPGSGRSTELARLAARRARGPQPEPTVWLRGAELRPGDGGIKDAVERSLRTAARIIRAAGAPAGAADQMPHAAPDAVADLARTAGRPLLVLLDAPEEMPPVLAHALAGWTAGTASWLQAGRVRLVVACRPEFWEQAGVLLPAALLHAPAGGSAAGGLPPCLRVGDLDPAEAARARDCYGLPAGALAPPDAAHPLALRLLSEIRAALPCAAQDATGGIGAAGRPPTRAEIFSAHLDLVCLRIAVRLAAGGELRGTGVRRLAARVAGHVHEAARRCLGPGQGELDREAFEDLFPWRTGWASVVLTEGLLVPAGAGYRFAHEEVADWLQGLHLDVDEALRALVLRWFAPPPAAAEAPVRLPPRPAARTGHPPPVPPAPPVAPPAPPRSLPVPRHRAGPVVQALLATPPSRLARHLDDLLAVLGPRQETAQETATTREAGDAPAGEGDGLGRRQQDAVWWAGHLVREVLGRAGDAAPYRSVLRRLAGRVAAGQIAGFGPGFWRRLALPAAERLELLRALLPADPPPSPGAAGTPDDRYLAAAAALVQEAPREALPVLCRWFDDDRPLRSAGPPLTVAAAAQAVLHTHRRLAVDDLTEALVTAAHPAADEVLAALAEDETSALCRAVDRWAHDPRPDRHVAAAAYARLAAPFVTSEADRELLRYAALTILARPGDCTLHGAALGLLVRDPATRARHLPAALAHFAAGDPHLLPGALAAALGTHPEPVLAAFQGRLRAADDSARDVLDELAAVTAPALARRAAALVEEHLRRRPQGASGAARFLDLRLEQGPAVRAVLLPFAAALLRDHPPEVRRALVPVLAAAGTHASRPLRQEILDGVLDTERDPDVLDALLTAVAGDCRRRSPVLTRDLVQRVGLLLGRTPEGAALFDRRIVELAFACPDFGSQVREWLDDVHDGADWDALIGPSARRRLDTVRRPDADRLPGDPRTQADCGRVRTASAP